MYKPLPNDFIRRHGSVCEHHQTPWQAEALWSPDQETP